MYGNDTFVRIMTKSCSYRSCYGTSNDKYERIRYILKLSMRMQWCIWKNTLLIAGKS